MKERAHELKAARAAARPQARRMTRAPCSRRSPRWRTRIVSLAERLHAVITATAPDLSPKLWYGMPAYAKDGKIVCFFQAAAKFKSRYATLGFNDPGESRRWRHVADGVRADGVDRCRGGRRSRTLVKRAVS